MYFDVFLDVLMFFNVIFRFVQLFLFEILINGLLMAPLTISKISKVNSVN